MIGTRWWTAAIGATLLHVSVPLAYSQTMRAVGLRAPVELLRDSAGIVHIRAQNEHDLFFAQGYSAARDRLFQLELWRRQATGTMAEVLGAQWVERDRASRLLKFRGSMRAELAHYHPRGASIITDARRFALAMTTVRRPVNRSRATTARRSPPIDR